MINGARVQFTPGRRTIWIDGRPFVVDQEVYAEFKTLTYALAQLTAAAKRAYVARCVGS